MNLTNHFLCAYLLVFSACVPARAPSPSNSTGYGTDQVKHMLSDRPQMREYTTSTGVTKYLEAEDTWFQWAANQFAKDATGAHVYWNDAEPVSKCATGDDDFTKGFVRISPLVKCGPHQGRVRTFEVLWRTATFELINLSQGEKFSKVYFDALANPPPRETFILQNAAIEYETQKQTCVVLETIFKLWAAKHDFTVHPEIWGCPASASFEKHMARFKDPQGYPWGDYGAFYDRALSPTRLKHTHKR